MSVTLDSGIIDTVEQQQPLVGGDEPVVAPLGDPVCRAADDREPEPPQERAHQAEPGRDGGVDPEHERAGGQGSGQRLGDLAPVLVHRRDEPLAVEQVAVQLAVRARHVAGHGSGA
jgi:hypothetical protein